MNQPCRYCEDRYSNCHSKCPRYKEWKAYMEKVNKKRRLIERNERWKYDYKK